MHKPFYLFSFIVLLLCEIEVVKCEETSTNENIRQLAAEPKIVGGSLAKADDAKYQVSIRRQNFHVCGGSLITVNKVLTAAHCLYDFHSTPIELFPARFFTVSMGSTHLNKATLGFSITKYVKHRDFDVFTLLNDIALLFLAGSVPSYHPTIHPIPLSDSPIQIGAVCTITGWGSTKWGGSSTADLLIANVTVIPRRLCLAAYKSLTIMQFCAGDWRNGGVDSCQGDSGGPLACDGILSGIVSWGDRCGVAGKPGVYTDVSYYRHWIDSNGAARNLVSIFAVLLVLLIVIF